MKNQTLWACVAESGIQGECLLGFGRTRKEAIESSYGDCQNPMFSKALKLGRVWVSKMEHKKLMERFPNNSELEYFFTKTEEI